MTEEEQQLLANVGGTLLIVQSTEMLLRFVLKYCLPERDLVALEDLERSDAKLRKKTLGQFLSILRERVDLDDKFDNVLTTFLDCRNMLAHRIEDIPGWDLHTLEGQKSGHEFLNQTSKAAMFVAKVFVGLIRAWTKQVGIIVTLSKEDEELMAHIDARYTRAVELIFFKKD